MEIKQVKRFYFTVEGETEKWYLDWLQGLINSDENATYKVKLDSQIQKKPTKRAKSLPITCKTIIYHLSDYESNEPVHVNSFKTTMDDMKQASKLGKQIKCIFGYSNFTFDFWIILHKRDCFGSYAHRSQYIQPINEAYGEKFEDMSEYKHKDNFQRLLSGLTMEDVRNAVMRAERIQKSNAERGYVLQQYKGFRYYKENPSLEIGTIIGMILKECGLM